MKNTFFGMAVITMVGCSMAAIEGKSPVLDTHSTKTPTEYARCLAPIWERYNAATTSAETTTGYRISAFATYNGVIALAVVDKAGPGAHVRVHLQADWLAGGWLKSARECL